MGFTCPLCGEYQSNMRKAGWFETKENKFIMSICDNCAKKLGLDKDTEVLWKELTVERSTEAIAKIIKEVIKEAGWLVREG